VAKQPPPCLECLKLPMCIGSQLHTLFGKCSDFELFIRKFHMVRIINALDIESRLQTHEGKVKLTYRFLEDNYETTM
jgi:hypothetical protein